MERVRRMKEGMAKLVSAMICAVVLADVGVLVSIYNLDEPSVGLSKTILVDDDFVDDPPNHKWDSIQEGLNDADNGDTVFVFNGTYYEQVEVAKTIDLIGEDRRTTIIDGGGKNGDVVWIKEHGVNVSGFTITNGGDRHSPYYDAGITTSTNHNLISGNNIIANQWTGITLGGNYNRVSGNNISSNTQGIIIFGKNNTISDNLIWRNSRMGIDTHFHANGNEVLRNTITENGFDASYTGIVIGHTTTFNLISENNVSSNAGHGIHIWASTYNSVLNNTFFDNRMAGVRLGNSASHNIVLDNDIVLNKGGLVIDFHSNSNEVSSNRIISNSYAGIIIRDWSVDNVIHGNVVELGGWQGIVVSGESVDNIICHNCLINNVLQADDSNPLNNSWHDPVLLEGNYWSDYTGVDDGSGIGKHAIAGDGIGDTLVPHPGEAFDHYPFIFPICQGPENTKPVADAGPNQTAYEGDTVYFNGTGSQGSGYSWHKLDVNFATDSALYLRTIDPLGPYLGGWEGGVMEWVTFSSSQPFWIGKKAGHLGQGPTGKDYTYYWKMHESGNKTLKFRAGNGGFDVDVYDETDGVNIVSGLHVEQGSEEVVRDLHDGHVYRVDFSNTFVLSGFPNDLDVLFELNETDILLTPNRESLVYYVTQNPLDLATEGAGVTDITFYSRGEQEFYAYYIGQLNHSEVEVGGGEIGLANPPYNTGRTPSEYSDTLLGNGNLSFSWDFDASEDSDNDGNTTNDVDATGATPEHTYPDNGAFTVTLTVTDGSGLTGTDTCIVTVLNVPPSVKLELLPMEANVSLRIAGEKWHDVSVELYEDNVLIAEGSLTRYPGSPDDQTLDLAHIGVDVSLTYSAIIRYTPWDDLVNGQPLGANPVWVILDFSDGEELRLQHNFNVNHPDRWVWEVDLTAALLSRGIGFEATATDPGADELTFHWDFGDGANVTNFYPNPYNVFPVEIKDSVFHVFSSGIYTVTLTVTDDDGGVGVATVDVSIP
jgi:parallel beta-helix repeat protein